MPYRSREYEKRLSDVFPTDEGRGCVCPLHSSGEERRYKLNDFNEADGIQISANGSYRKMNKDGKAWTARLSHVVYRMTPTTLEKPYLNPDWVEWLMGFPRKWTDISFGPKNPPTSRA